MKTIPIHPTPAMVQAAEEAYMPFGDMELAIKLAILEAPEVEQEPVAWQCVWPGGGEYTTSSYESAKNYREGAASAHGEDQAPRIRPLYTHPQPAPDAGWQPIETAPMDGTKILATNETDSSGDVRAVSFSAYHPNAQGKKCWRDGDRHKFAVTHWQPLPEPPK